MHVIIEPSNRANKKYKAIIYNHEGKKLKTIHFWSDMENFTMHHDPERKRLYLLRHNKEKEAGLWHHNA